VALEMADGSPIWDELVNYTPFLTDEQNGQKEALCRLEVVEALPGGKTTFLYADKQDEDMPRVEVYKTLPDLSQTPPDLPLKGRSQDAQNTKQGEDAQSTVESEGMMFAVSVMRETEIVMRLWCSADYRQAKMEILDQTMGRFCIDNGLMLLFAFASADKQTLMMHASVTVKDDKGYIFLGHSGTGKSTHSRLWQERYADAWLLNDDNPVVRIVGEEIRVYGTPWSGKTPCYKNTYAPVAAIVQLQQGPENKIRQQDEIEAFASVYSSTSGLKIDRQMADQLYETIAQIAEKAACYHLECLPNKEAAEVCYGKVGCR